MDFKVDSLGQPTIFNPIKSTLEHGFITDSERLLHHPHVNVNDKGSLDLSGFEVAGPREKIFFDPARVKAAIVTCGGLCPGLNAVIRTLFYQLTYRYGVRQVFGVRYGYNGLAKDRAYPLLQLTTDFVENIHERGGTILGTSRGTPPTAEVVDMLMSDKINILFAIGGDGTMRGASAIAEEVKKRKQNIAVVGIPKTIDNDIKYVRRSFGFESAVEIACESLKSAHNEAVGVRRGIGLVKLMGRQSGYITANATLASGLVNYCLVPEIPFLLEGENGLLSLLENRLKKKEHALIVVAEGAGQQYFKDQPVKKDLSGNIKLGDIGVYLRDRIQEYFAEKNSPVYLRYIDPSYLIRSSPPIPADSLFCGRLAQNAVHAAMAGKTSILIGYWHGQMTHLPLQAIRDKRQTINPSGELWFNVMETTGQPAKIGDDALKSGH